MIAAAPISTTSTTPTVRSMRTRADAFFPRDAFLVAMIRFLMLLKSINVLLVTAFAEASAGFRQSRAVADRFRPLAR